MSAEGKILDRLGELAEKVPEGGEGAGGGQGGEGVGGGSRRQRQCRGSDVVPGLQVEEGGWSRAALGGGQARRSATERGGGVQTTGHLGIQQDYAFLLGVKKPLEGSEQRPDMISLSF